ncbi:hypothetical protein [Ottowia testudinis]|uniref:Uncharacterized protein n=1 Tax=Ottowia testudinis TaxID=2816950 RepID=A0A975H1Z7_9BURK|nr:hypothetical protein [Ottowia testudinis]QTD43666.1 hypothetical protein J1M35_10850 [Ottowia testudinis]
MDSVKDPCALGKNQTDYILQALTSACAPQRGDKVSHDARRLAVRSLFAPHEKLRAQRYSATHETRLLDQPGVAASTMLIEFEPGPRQRTQSPGPSGAKTQTILIGEQSWLSFDGQPWTRQNSTWSAPERVSYLANAAILEVTPRSERGIRTLTVRSLSNTPGMPIERTDTVDLSRGLLLKSMHKNQTMGQLITIQYDWAPTFAAIDAPR